MSGVECGRERRWEERSGNEREIVRKGREWKGGNTVDERRKPDQERNGE